MSTQQIEKSINGWINEQIEGTDVFLVDLRFLPRNKVLILLDGDQGVTIEKCAQVSRYVGQKLEEENLIDHAYTLEVSSPGIDHPLKLNRQYTKNIGRDLAIKMQDGKKREGKLVAVNDTGISLEEKIKEKGKKARVETAVISFDEIAEAKVTITFR